MITDANRGRSRRGAVLSVLTGLIALYALGLGMRRAVLTAQEVGRLAPFTLESALHFQRVRRIYEGMNLPGVDSQINVPYGVNVRETYTVGSEYVQATLARWLPLRLPLAEQLRWIEAGWFCLGIPALAWWVGIRWRSVPAGAVAGLFYAVSISSVMRSTGQELSRENFALPLLLAHLAAAAAADRCEGRRVFWIWAMLSAGLLAWAMQAWDLVQYYLGLWMVAGWTRFGYGDRTPGAPGGSLWLLQLGALSAAGVWNPYLRAHGFLGTPAMMLGFGLLGAWSILAMRARRGGGIAPRVRWGAAAGALLLAGVGMASMSAVHDSYGHFGELLVAKLVHGNVKPWDPSSLSFNQRIMWVPALHSADLQLTQQRFPAILVASLLGGVTILGGKQARGRTDPETVQLIFYSGLAFVTFYYFVRFQVFLAVFASVLAGLAARWAASAHGVKRWGMACCLAIAAGVETGNVLTQPERWGRSNLYVRELDELVDWMGRNASGQPVLANFGTSAAVLAFADCPILLHPKFEGKAIRDRVRAFGEALFEGAEQEFWEWAVAEGAAMYIHGLGSLARIEPTLQMRYFVNAMDAPAGSAARLFEADDAPLARFQMVWKNRKYKVYRIRTDQDEDRARMMGERALEAFQRGNLEEAEASAMEALTLQPTNALALQVLRHVDNLRRSGFSYETP